MLLMAGSGKGIAAPQPTTATEPPEVRIALLSDPHVTRGTSEDQMLYRPRFERVLAAVNAQKVDLVLIAGDLTQNGADEQIADFQEQIEKLQAPVYCVYGNHDDGGKARVRNGKKEGVTAARLERIETALGPSFWVQKRAGVRVVGINASLFGSGLPREDEQWTFLEKILAPRSGAAAAEPSTLLLTHYPLFTETFDEPRSEYWNIDPEPRVRLLNLLERSGVKAVLSGHLHRPLTLQHAGVLHHTTLPISFGLPRGRQPQGWTLVTVSSSGQVQIEAQELSDEAAQATSAFAPAKEEGR